MKKKLALLLSLVMLLALSANAFAAEFVPSREQKAAPTLISATIERPDHTTYEVSSTEIRITPLSESGTAESGIKERLEKAYAGLKEGKLEDLIPGLKEVLDGKSMKPGELVVKDIFDVQVTGTAAQEMAAGGSLKLTLQSGLNQNQFLMLALSSDGRSWSLIDSQNGSNAVTFTMNTVGVIIFLTDGGTAAVDNTVVSPKTADMGWLYVVGAALIVAAVGALVCVKYKKSAAC